MKKLVSAVLFVVFALSFVAGVALISAEPAQSTVCMATCDYEVGYTLVCCPRYVGANNQVAGKLDCYYTTPCGPIN